jgi:hypothetical protein
MFWLLLFAHFVADYPFQTDDMVQAKKAWPGLTAHVAIHLVTMLGLLFGFLQADWRVFGPYVLALALIHFGIDTSKNKVSQQWPQSIIPPYLLDQVCHIISILLMVWLMPTQSGPPFAPTWSWAIYGSAYLLVTHVWFITERVLVYADKPYQQAVTEAAWPRSLGRTILLSALLLGWRVWGGLLLMTGLIFIWLHLTSRHRRRALLTDLAVVVVVASLVGVIL